MPKRPAVDLTRSFATLPAGEYADAVVTGLTLRVRPSGRRTFVLRYVDGDGRSVKYKLGEFPSLSLAQARKLARALCASDPQAERRIRRARQRRPAGVRTVAELIDRYLERAEARMRPRSFTVARQRLNKHVRPALGALRVGEVRPADVRALMEDLQRRGLGVTSNRCATALGRRTGSRSATSIWMYETRWMASAATTAPPRTLGEMRRRYDKQLEAVLLGELHKELIGRSGSDILAALQVK
jgi:hypothetical protein